MEIYLFVIFLVCVYAVLIFLKGATKRREKIFIILSCITMFSVMGARNISVGTDTELYCKIFERISASDNIFTVAQASWLYALYNKIISLVLGNYSQWIIIFNSLIIIVGIGFFIYNNSRNMAMSMLYFLLFYHYFQSFNISRQYIAIVLTANSFYFIKNKNLKGFMTLNLIATLFHNTSIVFMPMGILSLLELNFKKTIIFSAVSGVMIIFYEKLIAAFLYIFPRYSIYFGGNTSFYETGQGRKIIITLIYLMVVIISLIIMARLSKLQNYHKEKERELAILIVIMLIAIICGILSMKSILISRIELYYSIFAIILIPFVIEEFKKYKYLLYFVSICVMLIPTYIQLNDNIGGIVPYGVFFQW
ncbi:EpsG family protein [uncultured Clostridium sp.]|uniref:EpsG family protein n=1 Tax=uncultured Clostridium sp. TaxID=59620 RepID=UPI0028E25A65|nr:EpsG family protein [uncultured Clostridium sp.]